MNQREYHSQLNFEALHHLGYQWMPEAFVSVYEIMRTGVPLPRNQISPDLHRNSDPDADIKLGKASGRGLGAQVGPSSIRGGDIWAAN